MECDVTITPPVREADPRQPSNNLQQIAVGAHDGVVAPDGSVRGVNQITDGTSNTIGISEAPAPAGNSDPAAGGPNGTAAGLSPDALQAITDQLGDKQFSFGSSSGNSDSNAFLTGTTDITLCAFGRFGRVETIFFSSSVGDSEQSTRSNGTWRIVAVDGLPVLELHVESSSDPKQQPVEQLALASDANGNPVVNGHRADVKDAAADCAAAQTNP